MMVNESAWVIAACTLWTTPPEWTTAASKQWREDCHQCKHKISYMDNDITKQFSSKWTCHQQHRSGK